MKYLLQNNLAAIVIFLLVGFIVTCFTKNMIYVLLSAIIVTNLIITSNILNKFSILEGFKDENHKKQKHHNHNKGDVDHTSGDDSEDDDGGDDVLIVEEVGSSSSSNKAKSSKNQVPFKNLNEEFEDNDADDRANIDRSKTVQHAFNNLENILGSDGLSKMTENTEELAQRQERLIEAMEKMGPLMGMAQKMLKQLNSGAMGKLFGSSE